MFMLTHISKFPSPSSYLSVIRDIILAAGLNFATKVLACFVTAEM